MHFYVASVVLLRRWEYLGLKPSTMRLAPKVGPFPKRLVKAGHVPLSGSPIDVDPALSCLKGLAAIKFLPYPIRTSVGTPLTPF